MISLEILVLFIVVGSAFGIPLLVRSMVYPRRLLFEKASGENFTKTPLGMDFLKNETAVTSKGFSGGDILTVPSIPHPNFTRVFIHPEGTVMLLSVMAHSENEERRYFRECYTVFGDGSSVSTRSVYSFDTFTPPADMAVFSYFHLERVETLLDLHRGMVAVMAGPEVDVHRYTSVDAAVRDYQKSQNRILDYQVELGVLREEEDGDTLRAGYRIIPSIIRQNLRLFDRDISPRDRFRGIIIGFLVLTALAVLNSGPESVLRFTDRFERLFLGFFLGSAALMIGIPFRRNAIAWALFALSTPLLYLVFVWPPLRLHIFDFVLVIIGAGWLGSRTNYFRDMEGGWRNLVNPLICVLVAFMIILISG